MTRTRTTLGVTGAHHARTAALWLLLAALHACAHAPPPPTLIDVAEGPSRAPSPEEARVAATSAADPLAAADLSWVLGNDRTAARRYLDARVGLGATSPAARLRRARLAEAELDDAGARRELLALIREAPGSVEAALACARLTDEPGELPAERAEIVAAAREALLGPSPLTPGQVTQLALLVSRAGGAEAQLDPEVVARAGLLTEARTLGPLGPRAPALLATATEAELEGVDAPAPEHRGRRATPGRAFVYRGDLLPTEGVLEGLYVVDASFELAQAQTVALTVDLRGLGRVRVDGAVVLDHGPSTPLPSAVRAVSMALSAGRHRVTVAMLAGRADAVRLSVLGLDGRPVLVPARAGGAGAADPPADVRALPSELERALLDCAPDAAGLCVPRIAREADVARALLAELALARASRDIERARALVRVLVSRAPRSAVAQALEARLSALESLPASRTEAALRRALAEDPTHPGLLLAVARQQEADAPEAAMALIDRARAAAPAAVEPELARFRALRARGWNAEATASLEAVLARARHPSLLEEAARHHRTLVHLSRARALEAELEALLPTDARAIAQALSRGELDVAIERLSSAAPARARPAEIWRRVAELELGRGRPREALEVARRALSSEPSDPSAWRTVLVAARALADRPAWQEAIERLRALGAADLELELYAAELDGRVIGQEPAGSWLAQRLALDPRALAMAPADPRWGGAARVRLLDRIVEHVRPDGSSLSLRHQIVRLMNKDATDVAGEIRLPGGALALSLRTLKPDGRSIEVDRHAGKDDLSFSALAPGDSVEQEWIAVAPPASMLGGYLRRFLFQTDLPTQRAELVVVVPKAQPVWWKSYHGAPEPEVHEDATHRTYVFAARDVPGLPAEPSMAPIEEFLPFVLVAVGLDAERALIANRASFPAQARPSRDVSTVTASITRGLSEPEAKLSAIARWTSAHVRDAQGDAARALITGEGPQLATAAALLRDAGLTAELVLARSGREAQVEPPLPDPAAYDEVMLRVTLPGCPPATPVSCRRWMTVQGLSLEVGQVPPSHRGGGYLVVDPPSTAGPEPFLAEEVASWRLRSRAQLTLDAAGDLTGQLSVTFPGPVGAGVRQGFRPMRREDIARVLQGWLNGVLPGAELVDLTLGDLEPAPGDFTLSVQIRAPGVLGDEGGARVFRRFFEGPIGLKALGVRPLEGYLSRSQRQMPMLIDASAETLEVELTLAPELGAPVEPPLTFERDEPWARVAQRFQWDAGRRLVRLGLDTELRSVRVPVSAYPAFRAMAQEVTLKTKNRLILR